MWTTIVAFAGKHLVQILFVGLVGYLVWTVYHAGIKHQAAVDQPKVTSAVVGRVAGDVANQVQTDTLKADSGRITSEGILSKQTSEGVTDVSSAGLKAMQAPLPPDLVAAYQRVIDGMRRCELNPSGPGCGH